MRVQACVAGIDVIDFWDYTVREVLMAIKAYRLRMEATERLAISNAWYSAALSRSRRIPPLKMLLSPPVRVLTEEEASAMRADHERMTQAWRNTKL